MLKDFSHILFEEYQKILKEIPKQVRNDGETPICDFETSFEEHFF